MTERKLMGKAIEQAQKSFREGGFRSDLLARKGEGLAAGHNKRVQDNDPIIHAEIDCLRNTGWLGRFRDTVLFSTLMPCFLCAGAVVRFGICKVIVGDSRVFAGVADFMRRHGVEVIELDLQECRRDDDELYRGAPAFLGRRYRSLGNRRNTVVIHAVSTTICASIKLSLVILLL
jgi:creatinine deaminase